MPPRTKGKKKRMVKLSSDEEETDTCLEMKALQRRTLEMIQEEESIVSYLPAKEIDLPPKQKKKKVVNYLHNGYMFTEETQKSIESVRQELQGPIIFSKIIGKELEINQNFVGENPKLEEYLNEFRDTLLNRVKAIYIEKRSKEPQEDLKEEEMEEEEIQERIEYASISRACMIEREKRRSRRAKRCSLTIGKGIKYQIGNRRVIQDRLMQIVSRLSSTVHFSSLQSRLQAVEEKLVRPLIQKQFERKRKIDVLGQKLDVTIKKYYRLKEKMDRIQHLADVYEKVKREKEEFVLEPFAIWRKESFREAEGNRGAESVDSLYE